MSQQYPPQQPWHPLPNYSPISSTPRKRTLQQRFNALSSKAKISVSLATLLFALSLCICSVVAAANGNTNQSTSSNPSPTSPPPTQAAFLVATATDVQPTDIPTPSPTPTPKPTPRPTPTPTQAHCVAVNNNPWCYNFSPGNLIDYPPSGFCNYFNCITTFYGSDDPGDGYVIECQDGTYSQSGGESGACSYHGGESRPLYSH